MRCGILALVLHFAHLFHVLPFSLAGLQVCVVEVFFSSTRPSRGSPSCSRKVSAAPDRNKWSLSLGMDAVSLIFFDLHRDLGTEHDVAARRKSLCCRETRQPERVARQ